MRSLAKNKTSNFNLSIDPVFVQWQRRTVKFELFESNMRTSVLAYQPPSVLAYPPPSVLVHPSTSVLAHPSPSVLAYPSPTVLVYPPPSVLAHPSPSVLAQPMSGCRVSSSRGPISAELEQLCCVSKTGLC